MMKLEINSTKLLTPLLRFSIRKSTKYNKHMKNNATI